MCDFLFSDSLKILLTGEKLAHKFGGNNLSWWKQPMKTKGKTVELNISLILIESPEPVGPRLVRVWSRKDATTIVIITGEPKNILRILLNCTHHPNKQYKFTECK
jgi:hypothetical protein